MPQSEQAELDALNAAVDRMRNFIQAEPYMQKVLQDEPRYHHPSFEHAHAWRKGTPFDDLDEPSEIQYQTFFYHEFGTNLIQLEKTVASPPASHQPGGSGAATPSMSIPKQHGPKKKITLADYKNQKVNTPRRDTDGQKEQANGSSKPVSGQKPAAFGRPESTTRPLARANEKTSERTTPPPTPRSKAPGARKSHSETETRGDGKQDVPARPEQQPRTKTQQKDHTQQLKLHPKDHPALPELVSPLKSVMPGRLSPIAIVLPDRLSPDLPDNIVAELDRREREREETSTARSTKDIISGAVHVKHDSVRSHVQVTPASGTKRKLGLPDHEPIKRRRAASPNVGSAPDDQDGKGPKRLPSSSAPFDEKKERPTRIVKIKISVARRQALRRLLALPPKSSPPSRLHQTLPSNGHRVRSRSPSPKRHAKTNSTARKTPLQPPFQSPPPPPPPNTVTKHLSTPASKRPAHTSMASAMARTLSAESHIPSPKAATPNTTTSQPPATSYLKPSPPSAQSNATTALSRAWSEESSRLASLGKTLKNRAQTTISLPNPSAAEPGMLTSIESFCSFMLSFHAQDRACQTARPTTGSAAAAAATSTANPKKTWGTMHGLWEFTWRKSEPWPLLRGVVAGLGLVYLARIFAWLERNGNNSNSNNNNSNSSNKNNRAGLAALLADPGPDGGEWVREAVRISGVIAREAGAVTLPDLRDRWPRVWDGLLGAADDKRRAGDGGGDRLPGDYDGDVVWPLTLQTGVVEGVRTVMKMCEEWRLDKGSWEPTLKLKS